MTRGHPLLVRLARIRRGIRALSTARGLAICVSISLGSALLLISADWLLRFPPSIRLILALAWLGLLGILTYTRVILPATRPVDLTEIAAAIERRTETLQGRLVTATEHLLERLSPSPLAGRVVEEAERTLHPLQLWDVARRRGLLASAAPALALGLLTGAIAAGSSHWLGLGTRRYVHPFGPGSWPKRVAITPLTDHLVIASGEPAEIAARVNGGRWARDAHVVWRDGSGCTGEAPLKPRSDGTRAYTSPPLFSGIAYWFAAGDASTATKPGRIDVFPRTVITSAEAVIEPPAYSHRPASTISLATGETPRILAGSILHLTFHASQPIRAARPTAPDGEMEGSRHGGIEGRVEDNRVQCTIRADVGRVYRLSGIDVHGLAFHSQDIRFAVVPDEPPTVRIVEPDAPVDVTPGGRVRIRAEASDDVGLVSAKCVVARRGTTTGNRTLDWSGQLPSAVSRDAVLNGCWRPVDLGAAEGDTLTAWLEVTDNYEVDGRRHTAVRSQPVEIHVLAPARLAERLQRETARLHRKLHELAEAQERLRDAVRQRDGGMERWRDGEKAPTTLPQSLHPSIPLSQALADQQRQLREQMRGVSEAFKQLLARGQDNRLHEAGVEEARAMRELHEGSVDTRQLADGAMTRAAAALGRGDQPAAVAAQDQALADLQRMLVRQTGEGSRQLAERAARELLDQQRRLTRRTAELARRVPPAATEPSNEAASPDDAIANAIAAEQRRLAKEVDGRLTRMLQTQGSSAPNQQSGGSDAATSAAASAMHDAAKAIASGKAGEAGSSQAAAERGLSDLLAQLRPDPNRELAELSKKASDVQARVRELLQEQTAVAARVATAQTSGQLRELREPQSLLRARTQAVAPSAKKVDASGRAGTALATAMADMTVAGDAMTRAETALSRDASTSAAEGLRTALDALTEARALADRQLAAARREGLLQTLADARGEQQAINTATEALGDQPATQPGDDPQAIRVHQTCAALAKRERAVAGRLESLRKDLSGTPAWLLKAIEARLEGVIASLAASQNLSAIRQDQSEILARMDLLIAAVRDSPANAEEGFTAGAAGGRPGGSASEQFVSKFGELKLIRGLQADLAERTQRADASWSGGEGLRRLASDQRDLQELAAKVFSEGQR